MNGKTVNLSSFVAASSGRGEIKTYKIATRTTLSNSSLARQLTTCSELPGQTAIAERSPCGDFVRLNLPSSGTGRHKTAQVYCLPIHSGCRRSEERRVGKDC